MGYFRTPDRATEQILKRLAVKEGEQVILGDPCCGEGIALRAAADYFESLGAEVLTYGIEPDEHRAEEAKKRLDYVVKDGYENTSITNSAFSLWWFNPPYDVAAADEGEKAERGGYLLARHLKISCRTGCLFVLCPSMLKISPCARKPLTA